MIYHLVRLLWELSFCCCVAAGCATATNNQGSGAGGSNILQAEQAGIAAAAATVPREILELNGMACMDSYIMLYVFVSVRHRLPNRGEQFNWKGKRVLLGDWTFKLRQWQLTGVLSAAQLTALARIPLWPMDTQIPTKGASERTPLVLKQPVATPAAVSSVTTKNITSAALQASAPQLHARGHVQQAPTATASSKPQNGDGQPEAPPPYTHIDKS